MIEKEESRKIFLFFFILEFAISENYPNFAFGNFIPKRIWRNW